MVERRIVDGHEMRVVPPHIEPLRSAEPIGGLQKTLDRHSDAIGCFDIALAAQLIFDVLIVLWIVLH